MSKCFQMELGFKSVGFCGERKAEEPREKLSERWRTTILSQALRMFVVWFTAVRSKRDRKGCGMTCGCCLPHGVEITFSFTVVNKEISY